MILVKRSLVLGAAALAAISSYVVAWDGETYVLSVRDMEIAQDMNTDDVWSRVPDLVVRISRTEPQVRSQIDRLEASKAVWLAQRREAVRVSELYRARLRQRVSLTDGEIRRAVHKYKRKARALTREIVVASGQGENLQRSILGSSEKLRTWSRVVDFGGTDVIRVYPDDEIEVSVWDDDPFEDDLYGRATVMLDRATLERGSLDVSMPNIRFVRLKFRPDESVSDTE